MTIGFERGRIILDTGNTENVRQYVPEVDVQHLTQAIYMWLSKTQALTLTPQAQQALACLIEDNI